MTFFYSKILKEDKALNNLRIAKVSGNIWIDAGSGDGAYTIPLAQIVSRVIAIDQDNDRIDRLQALAKQKHLSNIQFFTENFSHIHLEVEPLDGILFAFSLHYNPEPYKAIANLQKYLTPGGVIVIIDYDRIDPVSWVRFPINKTFAQNLLWQAKTQTIEELFHNSRYYILKGMI